MSNKIEEMQAALNVLKDLDLDKVKNALALIGDPVLTTTSPSTKKAFVIGESYLIRTVTMYWVGRVKDLVEDVVFLEEASWIPDTGRFMQAVKNGSFNEVEPVGEWNVCRGSIVDFGEFTVKLPTAQK